MTLTPGTFGSVPSFAKAAAASAEPWMPSHAVLLKRPGVHLRDSLIDQATSLAVKASPSCHLTPGCKWKVYVMPSAVSQVSARSGQNSYVSSGFQHRLM